MNPRSASHESSDKSMGHDGDVLIASQLSAQMNERIRASVPGVRLAILEPGFPQTMPAGTRVFFAAPNRAASGGMPGRAAWVDSVEWIQVMSVGADGYPPWYFDVPRFTVSRGPAAVPVAEFALAAMMSHAKRMPDIWIRDASQWRATPLQMMHGATLGILGYGAIGRRLARLGVALGMNVIVSRRSAAVVDEEGVTGVSLPELIERSDHLVLAASATAETHHLINAQALQRAKPGLHIVNVARGSLIDQDALIQSLDSGRVSFATLDVSDPEPLPAGHALYDHPRVRLSPHLSAYDTGIHDRIAEGFIENLRRFLGGQPLLNEFDRRRGY